MKIAFFGTPEFARDILQGISSFSGIQIDVVVSQPDKPVGRNQELLKTPVKQFALDHGIDVFQPERLKNNPFFLEELKARNLDFIVVVAYGKILPRELLALPKYGCINIHGSLLPLYRGASPVQTAIKNGDTKTGLTIMYMDEKMDEGNILATESVKIDAHDTSLDVFKKFTQIGPKLLYDTLRSIVSGESLSVLQNHEEASYCHMIEKEEGWVHPEYETAQDIYNKFRAFYQWPGIYILLDDKRIVLEKISFFHGDEMIVGEGTGVGTFVKIDKKTYGILCADRKILLLHQVKPEGKKSMDIVSFVNGNQKLVNFSIK